MIIKKIAMLAVPFVMIENVNAECCVKAHGGFSIGGQLGYIAQDSKVTQRYKTLPNYHHSKDMSGRGVIGGLNLAYGHIFPYNFFLGAEIKMDFSDLRGHQAEGQAVTFRNRINLKMTNSYGGAIKIGGIFCSVLPYVKIGVLSSEWKSSSQILIGVIPINGHKHTRRAGLETGIGLDIPVTDRFAVGGEFVHVEYERFSYSDLNKSSGISITKISAKPRTNAFMLRAKYRFAC